MKHFWPLALEARTPFHLLVAPLYSISTVTSKCSNGTSKRLHVHGLLSMYIGSTHGRLLDHQLQNPTTSAHLS